MIVMKFSCILTLKTNSLPGFDGISISLIKVYHHYIVYLYINLVIKVMLLTIDQSGWSIYYQKF